jgi:hypothetical protein
LSFTDGFALFAKDFAYMQNSVNEAIGRIYAINPYGAYSANQRFEADISFIQSTMVKNLLLFYNLIPRVHLGAELIFIPGFTAYDDLGFAEEIFPIATGLRLGADIINRDIFNFNLNGFLGWESVGEYSSSFIYSFSGNLSLSTKNGFAVGILGGVYGISAGAVNNPMKYLGNEKFSNEWFFETGLKYMPNNFGIFAAFNVESIFKTIKTGVLYSISPKADLLAGFNLTLEYYGWDVNIGINLKEMQVFKRNTEIGLSTGITGAGAFTVNFRYVINFKKRLENTNQQ